MEGSGSIGRRKFLTGMAAVAGGVALGGPGIADLSFATRRRRVTVSPESIFELPASEAPIDTVVIVMLENRSFDHLIGWLGDDDEYLEEGRRLHGDDFRIEGKTDQRFENPKGEWVRTINAFESLRGESRAVRGCEYDIPGHSWKQGRVQRDKGFLAEGTGNDEFAISYYDGTAIPFHREIAQSFTTCDRYFASLLGPTFPNRQYLHSAQSEGMKSDPGPLKTGIYKAETIWDRLVAANVPAAYYYTDVPLLRLWGSDLKPLIFPLQQFFEHALAGTLPNVVMVDPGFKGGQRTDGHPRGDVRLAGAFAALIGVMMLASPQWSRSMMVVTYDEWGGFFDHVRPRHFPDDRASKNDQDDFSQAGFRVPAGVFSPYSPSNAVDHTPYDHTSILRFLEWRFLGAPPRGPGPGSGGQWWLTTRDRHAHPIGQTLVSTQVNTAAEALLAKSPQVNEPIKAPACEQEKPELGGQEGAENAPPPPPGGHDAFSLDPSFDEEIQAQYPPTELPFSK